MSNGLIQLTSAEIQNRINHQKLFGVDELFEYLFNFCKICLTADKKQIDNDCQTRSTNRDISAKFGLSAQFIPNALVVINS